MGEGDFLYCYLNLLIDEERENGEDCGFNPNFDHAVKAAGRKESE